MNKPEKKSTEFYPVVPNTDWNNGCNVGYNQAHDELTAYYESPEYIQQLITKAKIEEYTQEVIPLFDGLFTDAEHRKSFYNAVEERITEIEKERG